MTANEEEDETGLNEQVASSEEAGPYVTISDDHSAFFIGHEVLAQRARKKETVEGEAGSHQSVLDGIHLHTVVVEIATWQAWVLRIDQFDYDVQDGMLRQKVSDA